MHDYENELMIDIEKYFNPADDVIDQYILEEITGSNIVIETEEKNEQSNIANDYSYNLNISNIPLVMDERQLNSDQYVEEPEHTEDAVVSSRIKKSEIQKLSSLQLIRLSLANNNDDSILTSFDPPQ